jgi:hypothetical protein
MLFNYDRTSSGSLLSAILANRFTASNQGGSPRPDDKLSEP